MVRYVSREFNGGFLARSSKFGGQCQKSMGWKKVGRFRSRIVGCEFGLVRTKRIVCRNNRWLILVCFHLSRDKLHEECPSKTVWTQMTFDSLSKSIRRRNTIEKFGTITSTVLKWKICTSVHISTYVTQRYIYNTRFVHAEWLYGFPRNLCIEISRLR